MRKILGIVIIASLLITMFSACGVLQKFGLGEKTNDETSPVSSIVMSEEEAQRYADKMQVYLYFADETGKGLRAEVRSIPKDEAKKSVNKLAEVIVNQLISGPGKDTGLKATIPEATKLRSPITIEAGVATVDFTKDFVDKYKGDKDMEKLTIYSVVNSLTELKEIEKVRFTIEGKSENQYRSVAKFNEPFTKSTSLISNPEPIQEKAAILDDDEMYDDVFDESNEMGDGVEYEDDEYGSILEQHGTEEEILE